MLRVRNRLDLVRLKRQVLLSRAPRHSLWLEIRDLWQGGLFELRGAIVLPVDQVVVVLVHVGDVLLQDLLVFVGVLDGQTHWGERR